MELPFFFLFFSVFVMKILFLLSVFLIEYLNGSTSAAMSKRKHESLSPPLTDGKKNNHPFAGTESANVNAIKKSKAHMVGLSV